jgi:hypothetical protein
MVDFAVSVLDLIDTRLTDDQRDWIIQSMQRRLRQGLAERERFIAKAKAGDELAHAILMAEFDEYTEAHLLPPHSLVEYERWARKHGPPRRRRGARQWWEDVRRDIGICFVIALVCEQFGLHPTRNAGTIGMRECGASIGRLALRRRFRIKLTESRLREMWGLYGDGIRIAMAARRVRDLLGGD